MNKIKVDTKPLTPLVSLLPLISNKFFHPPPKKIMLNLKEFTSSPLDKGGSHYEFGEFGSFFLHTIFL